MPATFQLVIDCRDPDALCRFWTVALGYVVATPPAGFESWPEFWVDFRLDAGELVDGDDRIVDPLGNGPQIWFQQVPEPKSVKNRLHLDIAASGAVPASGARTLPLADRRMLVEAKVEELVGLGAAVLHRHDVDGLDHYAVTMADPEGNEFCVRSRPRRTAGRRRLRGPGRCSRAR